MKALAENYFLAMKILNVFEQSLLLNKLLFPSGHMVTGTGFGMPSTALVYWLYPKIDSLFYAKKV